MKAPKFLVDQLSRKQPILIIDRKGVIGKLLADSLKEEFLPVLVSGEKPSVSLLESVVYIPFHKKPPKIPENNFSYVFFVDDESRVARGMISSLVSYVEKHGVVLSVITSIYQRKLRQLDSLSDNSHVLLFVYGDIFGLEYTKTSVLGSLLLAAKHKNHLTLPNHGLDDMYPVSVAAVVGQILKTLYSPVEERGTALLYPQHPVTGLSLSRILLSINPEINIDFVKKKHHFPEPLWFADSGVYASLPGLEEQVKRVFSDLPEEESTIKLKRSRNPLPDLSRFFLYGLSVFLLVAMPILILLGFGFAGGFLTQRSLDSLEAQSYEQARVHADQAKQSFAVSLYVSDVLMPVSKVIGRGVTLSSFAEKIQTARDVNDLLIDVSFALELYKNSQEEQDNEKAKALAVSAMQKLKQALLGLSVVEAEGRIPQEYTNRLAPYTQAGEYFLNTADVLPSILGYDGKRTYLLLFQNNNELRPGGGFIGSYGLLHMERGTIEDIQIHDVYDADGQLTSHVEPPFPLREYMGVSHWYLRDSNFAVDFPENAARAAFFLKLETGDIVDGVIAVDTTFIAHVLQATGPIQMQDFNQTITHENFAEITQHEIEDEFFPGSQKKKQFLAAFYNQLSDRLLTSRDVSLPLLLSSITDSLEKKHMLFAFANEKEQIPFTVSNLSGSLWDRRGASSVEPFFYDTLGINEANLGENKVNSYIQRYITHDVVLDEEGVSTTEVTISYKNTSSEGSPFGGVYKNYVRFITPVEATAVSLSIDGEERVLLDSVEDSQTRVDRGPVSDDSVSVDRAVEKGKQTLGFLLEVPPNETVEMTIVFQVQTEFSAGNPEYLYDLMLIKQPGRVSDPYTFSFTYPDGYQVITSSDDLSPREQSLTSFFLLEEDVSYSVLIGEK